MAFRNLEFANLPAIFWKGVITLLPLAVTLYGLVWVVMSLESMLENLVPAALCLPGLGLRLALLFILLFGALMHIFLFERIVDCGSNLLQRIPVIKTVYRALQDFVMYLGPSGAENLSLVVMVTIGENVRVIGFVTNQHPAARLVGGRGDAPGADRWCHIVEVLRDFPWSRRPAGGRQGSTRVDRVRQRTYSTSV